MSKRKTTNILLFFILTGALLVRLWGINFGLPHIYFGDEGYLIYWAFYSGSHALRPPYYLYAPLIPMILLVEFTSYYLGGYILGVFSSTSGFYISHLADPTILYLIGRVTMAIAGVATVWLVFTVGKTFFSQRIGFLAAFFLAFSFLHVKESHYIKQDVLMGFFVLVSFYFALKILQKGKFVDYILCGITFALAFGAKYHAIILLPVILLAHVFSKNKNVSGKNPKLYCSSEQSESRTTSIKTSRFVATLLARRIKWLTLDFSKLVWFGFVFLVTFSIIHPYFILETKSTIEQALPLAAGSRVLYPEHLQGKSVWWWFLFEHIPQGIGYPLFFSAIVGFIICLLRGIRRVKRGSQKVYFFILLLPIIFFMTIDVVTQMHFARYAVLILPFFMLAAAIFLDSLSRKLKIRNALLIIFAVVLILPTFFRTVQFDNLLTKPDTRTLAKAWFEQTVPSGSKVLVESTLKPEHPSSFNVSLALDEKSIDKRIQEAEKRGLEALYLRSLKQANKEKIGYDIVATTQVGAIRDIFTDKLTRIKDVSYYVDSGVAYIVLTSWVQEKMSKEFEKSLHKHYRLIQEFRPTYDFQIDPHLVRVDYAALDRVDILRTDVVFGPVISIYQLQSYSL